MALQDIFQGDRSFFSVANALEGALGEINVFQVLQMLQDCLAHVKAFGAARTPRKFLQPFFDGLWKTDGQHGYLAIQV